MRRLAEINLKPKVSWKKPWREFLVSARFGVAWRRKYALPYVAVSEQSIMTRLPHATRGRAGFPGFQI